MRACRVKKSYLIHEYYPWEFENITLERDLQLCGLMPYHLYIYFETGSSEEFTDHQRNIWNIKIKRIGVITHRGLSHLNILVVY